MIKITNKIDIIFYPLYKYLALYLNRKVRKLINIKEKDKKYLYESLIPTSDINITDKNRKYSEAILEALERPNVTNVALTGAYGSGKSSLIQSFIKEYPTLFKYLHISLANFPDFIDESDSEKSDDTKNKNKLSPKQKRELSQKIELSILQQIFYHVSPQQIPDSRFKRIKKFKWKRNSGYSLCVALWLVITYLTFHPSWLTKFFTHNNLLLLKNHQEYITLVLFCLCGFGLVIFIFKVIKYLNNSRIEKFNLKDGEIAISSETSMLNKHLDEIIYFFEKTSYDVIIIEDLDRFEDTTIFSKLREINILLNQSEQIARKISFLYAIRDDIFKDKDRVKFFDSIIPVIPIINVSNSKEILNRLVGKDKLNSEFVSNVAFFIDDMRLLKNIVNEYKLYNEKIEPLNQEQLFAIIIYKNISPSDFVALHKGEGFLYNLVSDENRRKLIEKEKCKLEEEITKLQNRNIEMESQIDLSHKDIRRIYLVELIKNISNFRNFLLDGNIISVDQLIENEDDVFDELFNNPINYQYWEHRPQYSSKWNENATGTMDLKRLSEITSYISSYSYTFRVDLIRKRVANEKVKNINEISVLKTKIRKLISYPLHEVLKLQASEVVSELTNDNPLITYFIKNNFINRNYYDYISYFYEGSLSNDDRQFISALRYNDNYDTSRPLNKISNVIKEITNYQFQHSAVVFNYSLVGYLLKDLPLYRDTLELLLSRNYMKSIDSKSFVKDYVERGENVGKFLNLLIPKWESVWSELLINDNTETNLGYILESVDIENIILLNNDKHQHPLEKYIENKIDFLSYSNEYDREKIKSIISELDFKFKRLVPVFDENNKNDLLEYIYKGSFYEINKYMLDLILQTYTKDKSLLKLTHAHYTSILESSCEELKQYVQDNIDSYSKILINLESNNSEKEEFLISLYNNDNVELEVKKRIAIKQKNRISSNLNIGLVDIRAFLINNSLVIASWENIMRYFMEVDKIDEHLLSFLNNQENTLSIAETNMEASAKRIGFQEDELESFINNLARHIALCSKLNEEVYTIYLKEFPIGFSDLEFANLHQWQAIALIDTCSIGVTAENYTILEQNFINNLHFDLLTNEPEYALELILEENINIGKDGYKFILASESFTREQKLDLIFKTQIVRYITSDKELSNIVVRYLGSYNDTVINIDLLKSLFPNNIDVGASVNLLLTQLDFFDESQISILLNALGKPFSWLTISRKNRYSIKNIDYKHQLIERLKSKNLFVSKYETSDNEIKINNKVF